MDGSYEQIKKNGDACCDPSEETGSSDPVNQTKGKKLWKKVKYELIGYHSLPAYLKDNEYIQNHYRAEWPLAHILRSVFLLHNETGNVWTHLIGFFLFLGLTIYTAQNIPIVADLHPLQRLANRLPNPFSILDTYGAKTGLGGWRDRAYHSLAVLRLFGRSHVLPAGQQRLPLTLLPLAPPILPNAPPGLRGNRRPDHHLILPARLLLLHVQPLLLPPLPGHHHHPRPRHHPLLPPPRLPEARVPPHPRLPLLRDGALGHRARCAQADPLPPPARGDGHDRVRAPDGGAVRGRSADICHEGSRAVEAREVRPGRA